MSKYDTPLGRFRRDIGNLGRDLPPATRLNYLFDCLAGCVQAELAQMKREAVEVAGVKLKVQTDYTKAERLQSTVKVSDEQLAKRKQATPHSATPVTKDNREIRKALEKLEVPKMVVWVDKEMKVETTNLVDKTVDEILVIFATQKSHLLDTLLEAMPKKQEVYGGESRDHETAGYNQALTEVETIIKEMKK